MEGVIEDLRARLRSTAPGAARRDLSEVRLEVACTWGSGHLLVTGSDRAEVDNLLDRVIRKTDPMGTIRARAGDPVSTVDRLIDLLDSESEVTGHLDRRRALLQLLARAQEARKSIFVVVDDADAASVEQLEKLRTTIEVAPDALERLRLILVGSSTLAAKLDVAGARALSSRITSRIRVGAPEDAPLSAPGSRGSLAALASQGFSWTFAAAAAVAFAVISYATVLLLAAPETARFDRIALDRVPAPAAVVAAPSVAPGATAALPRDLYGFSLGNRFGSLRTGRESACARGRDRASPPARAASASQSRRAGPKTCQLDRIVGFDRDSEAGSSARRRDDARGGDRSGARNGAFGACASNAAIRLRRRRFEHRSPPRSFRLTTVSVTRGAP
jgi:hypothetical protein